MHGPAQRLIQKQGREYTIRNAADPPELETPTYSDDGTLTGVLERRTRPDVITLSSGEEVESELELRAVYDSSATTIVEAGKSSPETKLVHPDGPTYRVLATYPEDSGVTVLTLERE